MRFIKLSKTLINTAKIVQVNSYTDVYHIHMCNNNISGFLIGMFGTLTTNDNWIRVCKKDAPDDYKIIQKWVDMHP